MIWLLLIPAALVVSLAVGIGFGMIARASDPRETARRQIIATQQQGTRR